MNERQKEVHKVLPYFTRVLPLSFFFYFLGQSSLIRTRDILKDMVKARSMFLYILNPSTFISCFINLLFCWIIKKFSSECSEYGFLGNLLFFGTQITSSSICIYIFFLALRLFDFFYAVFLPLTTTFRFFS